MSDGKGTGLIRSQFLGARNGEPDEIRAHEDGIQLDVFFKRHRKPHTVLLAPEHIEVIVEMYKDHEARWQRGG